MTVPLQAEKLWSTHKWHELKSNRRLLTVSSHEELHFQEYPESQHRKQPAPFVDGIHIESWPFTIRQKKEECSMQFAPLPAHQPLSPNEHVCPNASLCVRPGHISTAPPQFSPFNKVGYAERIA
jgi:hypothetical protein